MTSALSVVPGKGWALFDLLIYQDGVLVLPMDLPMPDRAVNAKSRGWQERRLSAVAGLSRSALSERPGAVFFPFGTTTITVGLGPYRSVTLTPTTGESMRLRKNGLHYRYRRRLGRAEVSHAEGGVLTVTVLPAKAP